MFSGCKKIKKLELENFFTTDSLIKMDSMFSSCFNLEKIQMPNINTKNNKENHEKSFPPPKNKNLNLNCNEKTNFSIRKKILPKK